MAHAWREQGGGLLDSWPSLSLLSPDGQHAELGKGPRRQRIRQSENHREKVRSKKKGDGEETDVGEGKDRKDQPEQETQGEKSSDQKKQPRVMLFADDSCERFLTVYH